MKYPRPHGCLYKIDFLNGKSYVGVSLLGAERRLRDHESVARRRAVTALHRALVKYGRKAYCVSTLVIADDFEYLKTLEIKAIAAFGTKIPTGYNMTDGGDGQLGKQWSIESREKLAAQRKGKDYLTPKARAALGKRLQGRIFSEEHRRRLSEAGRRRKRRILGPHSEEHKAKIAASHRGLGHTLETKARLATLAREQWARRSDRRMSEEQKRKISAAHLVRHKGDASR